MGRCPEHMCLYGKETTGRPPNLEFRPSVFRTENGIAGGDSTLMQY